MLNQQLEKLVNIIYQHMGRMESNHQNNELLSIDLNVLIELINRVADLIIKLTEEKP